jgi:hypothetical protein
MLEASASGTFLFLEGVDRAFTGLRFIVQDLGEVAGGARKGLHPIYHILNLSSSSGLAWDFNYQLATDDHVRGRRNACDRMIEPDEMAVCDHT